MSYHEILTTVTLLFLIFSAINLTRYRRKCSQLHEEQRVLIDEQEILTSECSVLREKLKEQLSFSTDLAQAELTTKLQSTRTGYHSNRASASPPERYRYINSLSKSGATAEKIASLFTISTHEAEQLVALSRIVTRS